MRRRGERLHVRFAEVTDKAALAELLDQLGYPCAPEQVEARLEALAEREDHHVLVAELSLPTKECFLAGLGVLEVGYLFHAGARHGHLTSLVVDRRFRHRGVARALLAEIEAVARRSGCTRLHLRSHLRRDDAHAFCRAVGFEETHLDFEREL
ncbi:MAG: GNAT family N-acetyltransferase [Myxococcota bacterium]